MEDSPEQSRTAQPSAWLVLSIGIAFSAVWSSAFVAGKIGLAVAEPLTLLSVRFCLAGATVLLALLLSGRWSGWPAARVVAAGVLGNAVYLGLVFLGMRSTPVAVTSILVCSAPLLTALLGRLWLHESLTSQLVIGLALSFAGVALIMGSRAQSHGVSVSHAALIGLGALALAASGLLNQTAESSRDGMWAITGVQLIASGLFLLPVAIILEGFQYRPGPTLWLSLIYLAGPVSIGGSMLMLWLIRNTGASRAGSFHMLNPAFGLGMSAVWLGEPLLITDALGLVPLVAGLALVVRSKV